MAGPWVPFHARAASDLDRPSGYVALMSSYIGRGLSQSVGEPSLQVELEYFSSSGWYAGVDGTTINWVERVYPGSSARIEIDAYAGYRWRRGDWTLKGGVLRLAFPGRYPATARRPDTTEVFAYAGWRGFGARFNQAVGDAFGTPGSSGSWYADLSAGTAIGKRWSASAHLGRKQSRGHDPATGAANARASYTDYKLSLARAFGRGVTLTLAHSWTTADTALYTLDGFHVAGRHTALTLQKDF